MKAKHRFIILRIIILNWLSKTTQRISNLVSHILQELRVQILKTYENKPKRPLVTFVSMALKCPISNGMFPSKSASKVILHPNKYFIFIMELYKLDKIGRKSTRKSMRSETQTLYVWNIYSKLALNNYIGVVQHGLLCSA